MEKLKFKIQIRYTVMGLLVLGAAAMAHYSPDSFLPLATVIDVAIGITLGYDAAKHHYSMSADRVSYLYATRLLDCVKDYPEAPGTSREDYIPRLIGQDEENIDNGKQWMDRG